SRRPCSPSRWPRGRSSSRCAAPCRRGPCSRARATRAARAPGHPALTCNGPARGSHPASPAGHTQPARGSPPRRAAGHTPVGPRVTPRSAGGLRPAVPEPPEPGRRLGELGVRGTRAYLRAAAVVARVAAEEPHLGAHPAQAHQRLADPGVVEVTLAVDGEAVL